MKKYQIIYADPPWSFKNYNDKTATKFVGNHYSLMTKKDIQELPIQNICADNCALFLWATAPCLPEAIELVEKWGFTYKTVAFTWVKRNKKTYSWFWGMGYYTRSNAEFCLLATKGKPLKRISKGVHSVLDDKIMEHSKKPESARSRIVELFGDISRIELFARNKTEGWDIWGNELENDITFN